MKKIVAAALLFSALPAPVMAKDWPELEGWNFIQGPDYCEMTTEYDGSGKTRFSVMLSKAGAIWLGANNSDWKLDEKKNYKIAYSIEKDKAATADAQGWAGDGRTGFAAPANEGFVRDMLTAGYLQFKVEDAGVVDDLDLSGSDNAYTQLKACVAQLDKAAAAH